MTLLMLILWGADFRMCFGTISQKVLVFFFHFLKIGQLRMKLSIIDPATSIQIQHEVVK